MVKSTLRTEEQGRGMEGEEKTMGEEGRGFSSKNTSWINKSNQWLCPHLNVSGRLKQNLKLWNICQQGWANTGSIITEETTAAVGPKPPLSDSLDQPTNRCCLENQRHNCWTLIPYKGVPCMCICEVKDAEKKMCLRTDKYTILRNYFQFQYHPGWVNTIPPRILSKNIDKRASLQSLFFKYWNKLLNQ